MIESNGDNGDRYRSESGKFLPGNSGGPGNPRARQIHAIRKMFQHAVDAESVRKATLAVIEKAKKGDVFAFNAILDRLLGKPSRTLAADAPARESLDAVVTAILSDPTLASLADRLARKMAQRPTKEQT